MPAGAPAPPDSPVGRAVAIVSQYLANADLEFQQPSPTRFVVVLPGVTKLRTTTSLTVEAQALVVNAFVARHPDEAHQEVYRWLLARNARTYAVSFCLDSLGDIYLAGRVPLAALSDEELDRILGSVLEYADGSFNTILKLGFAAAIRREHAWRVARGESTANLSSFAELIGQTEQPGNQ